MRISLKFPFQRYIICPHLRIYFGQIDDVINSGHFRPTDHEGNHVGNFLDPLGVSNDNLKSNLGGSNVHTGGGAGPRVKYRVFL